MDKPDLRTGTLTNLPELSPHLPGVLAPLLLRRYSDALCAFGQVPSSLAPFILGIRDSPELNQRFGNAGHHTGCIRTTGGGHKKCPSPVEPWRF